MAFLAMLSITQATVVWAGLASGMLVCVWGVAHQTLTVGDAVLFITMMNQLYIPLTFFGSYYRQVRCSRFRFSSYLAVQYLAASRVMLPTCYLPQSLLVAMHMPCKCCKHV